ncbi:amidase [Chelatococcus reniformis]|uniref:Amidase n=1 Tax=Chelatococcus reniformis TaxID=1494448 RepID=A0A916UU48_9HYPH|nr:amidase [Chelatococcus reniformis]GGC86850.1 amidase [Chelatococcus reniformis]
MQPFAKTPLSEIRDAVAAGAIEAERLVRWTLARIRAAADLEAFVYVGEDALVADAAPAPSAGPVRRSLAGLPVAVKDIFETSAMPTSFGSKAYAGHRPVMDAAIVTALRQRGAIVAGKTATTEFAAWPPARTRNPLDSARSPGGSSAGSAAAVAAGLVPLAIGTQTLGSVVRPASYCGVVGFKPTYARLSRAGLKPLAESLDSIGLFARSVADVRLLYEALVDEPGPETADRRGLRLGFCRGAWWSEVAPDARAAIEASVGRLRAAGLAIDDVDLGPAFADLVEIGRTIHDFEMRRGLMPEYIAARDRLAPSMAAGIERAGRWTAADHRDALGRAEEARMAFQRAAAGYDALLCAAAATEAPDMSHTGDPSQNIPWTVLHVPCLTLPAATGATGMPIGLQVVAERYAEPRLLAVADALERLLSAGAGTASSRYLPAWADAVCADETLWAPGAQRRA